MQCNKNFYNKDLQIFITANANFTEDDLEKLLEEGNPFQVFTGNVMLTSDIGKNLNNTHNFDFQLLVDTAEMKQQLADLEERHKQLLQVEERLKEVHDLFQEIAVLIEMQVVSKNFSLQDSFNKFLFILSKKKSFYLHKHYIF